MSNTDRLKRAVIDCFRDAARRTGAWDEAELLLDDYDFVIRWQHDRLTAEEHDTLIAELATRPRARRRLVELLDAGDLEFRDDAFPGAAGVGQDTAAILPKSLTGPWKNIDVRRKVGFALAAVAALVLMIYGVGEWRARRLMAEVRGLAAAQQWEAAWQTIDRGRADVDREADRRLIGQIAWHVAGQRLRAGRFDAAKAVVHKGLPLASDPDALVALEWQANVEIRSPNSFEVFALIDDYERAVLDRSTRQRFDKISRSLEQGLREHPTNSLLRLNYAQALLMAGKTRHARTQLDAVHDEPLQDTVAVGRALATAVAPSTVLTVSHDPYQLALTQFTELQARHPEDFSLALNRAICLHRLNRLAEANRALDRAASLARTPQQHRSVDQWRDKTDSAAPVGQ